MHKHWGGKSRTEMGEGGEADMGTDTPRTIKYTDYDLNGSSFRKFSARTCILLLVWDTCILREQREVETANLCCPLLPRHRRTKNKCTRRKKTNDPLLGFDKNVSPENRVCLSSRKVAAPAIVPGHLKV